MAKKMRKLMAALMALCLCATLILPAAAEEIPVEIDTTAGTVEGTQTTTESSSTDAGGSTTVETVVVIATPEGGSAPAPAPESSPAPAPAPETTTNVVYQETVVSTTTTNSDGQVTAESSTTTGSETVTQTTVTEGEPETKEEYAGSVEVTFDKEGNGSGSASLDLPEAPEGAENVTEEDNKISWEEIEDGTPVAGEGNGTDVDGDGITDTIITETDITTSTTVERTDREVNATLTEGDTKTDLGDTETGEVEVIGGAELPAGETWETLSPEAQAKVAKIQDQLYFGTEEGREADAAATQLALNVLLHNGEIPADTDEAVKSAAQALIKAANAQKETEAPAAPVPETPAINVTNVSFTVNEQEDNSGSDDSNTKPVYDTSVKFDVYVTTGVTGDLLVSVIPEGSNTPLTTRKLTEDNRNADGSYSVNIENMKLQEGVGIDLDIQLEGVQELDSNEIFVYSTTVEKPVDVQDQTLTGGTSHKGNDHGNGGGETSQGKNEVVSTESWSKDNYNKDFSVGNATVNIKAAGKTSDDREIVTVSSDKTIEVESIVIKAADGYIKYEVPGGKLIAGVVYTVENIHNSVINKTGGISHVSIYGSGKETTTPTEKVTETILGTAEESRDVKLGMNMKLNFEVKEATLTTTTSEKKVTTVTRTWEDSSENTYTPEKEPEKEPEKTPENEPRIVTYRDDTPVYDNEPADNEPAPRILRNILNIPDEKIPLAKAPKTGDLSGIWAVISGLSLGGVALLNRKRKEEE